MRSVHVLLATVALTVFSVSSVIAMPSTRQMTEESLSFGRDIDFVENVKVDIAGAEASADISVRLPGTIVNGNVVPVFIDSSLNGVKAIDLYSNRHNDRIASFTLGKVTLPYVSTRFRVGKSGELYVVMRAGNKDYYAVGNLNVLKSGQENMRACDTDARFYTTVEDGVVTIKYMIMHCMNVGRYIKWMKLSHDGETIVESELSLGVSRNPFFSFKFMGNERGSYKLEWEDTAGDKGVKIYRK
ncbi:thiosulfate oxidation carrier complex protein SoxZ [Thioalbus denitrificans]|uniref:Putative secreted protein n=1 Tax=Thioalbus denitrificans TaxID=547122 RepID=A0A369C8H2_9GAMM|nr:thiosulfate oxidation carrier complex protein SoxZ [Thioalbus denitrificans]RCX30189.1 putative secreted protein [Thioalbus denitrificans]